MSFAQPPNSLLDVATCRLYGKHRLRPLGKAKNNLEKAHYMEVDSWLKNATLKASSFSLFLS